VDTAPLAERCFQYAEDVFAPDQRGSGGSALLETTHFLGVSRFLLAAVVFEAVKFGAQSNSAKPAIQTAFARLLFPSRASELREKYELGAISAYSAIGARLFASKASMLAMSS
jgi:hypothetical protein